MILIGSKEELEKNKGQLALTTAEAAARVRLCERAFRNLIQQGEITPYEEKLGNYQLFDERDVETLRQKRLKRF